MTNEKKVSSSQKNCLDSTLGTGAAEGASATIVGPID